MKHHDIYPAPKGAPDPAPGRKELWSSDCTIRLRGVLIAYVVMISPKLGSRLARGRQPGCAKGASSGCCHLQCDGVMLDQQHCAYHSSLAPTASSDEATRVLKLMDLSEVQK